MNSWYVLQIPTGKEREIADTCRLSLAGIPAKIKLFNVERLKRYHGAWHKEICPMFPGYLIFEGNPSIVSERLSHLVVFNRVLKNNSNFQPLYDSEIEFLKRLADENLCVKLSEGYIEGEQVFVTRGPMVNFTGKIKKIDRHKRTAVIEAEIFGRSVEFKLGFEIIAVSR